MRQLSRRLSVPLLASTLVIALPAAACCRIEIGGGEVKVGGGGSVTVTPPTPTSAAAAVATTIAPAVAATIAPVPALVAPVTKVIDDAGKEVGKITANVEKEAGIGLANVVREGTILHENTVTTIRVFGGQTSEQLKRSGKDIEDAGTAIYRFTINELNGTHKALSNAEQRFRDGKVVDAVFHLATEPIQNTDKSAAAAAQESQLLSTIGSVAASVYGGPTGAAAYAAWLTYHQTGDINMAIRVGVIAGVSSYANKQASSMPSATATDSIKRAAVVGAIGGAAVAAAGGNPDAINTAFLRGGAAILVQDGYTAVSKRDLVSELGPATGPARCMSAPLAGGGDGCPGPNSYVRDSQGRYVMTDKNGKYHYVSPQKVANVPKDWRPVGDSATTPPGTPVVGIQTDLLPPLSQMNEGSAIMRTAALIPGTNAMALFHDRWAVGWEMGPAATKISIVPAIVLTYVGATVAVDSKSTNSITNAAKNSAKKRSAGGDQSASSAPTTGAQKSSTKKTSVSGQEGDTKLSEFSVRPENPAFAMTHADATVSPINAPGKIPVAERSAAKVKGSQPETLICRRENSLTIASVVIGKQKTDLACVIVLDSDGKTRAPYFARHDASACAGRLARMGRVMRTRGWDCRVR